MSPSNGLKKRKRRGDGKENFLGENRSRWSARVQIKNHPIFPSSVYQQSHLSLLGSVAIFAWVMWGSICRAPLWFREVPR